MPFPRDRDAMIEQGYRFDNHATCRGCKADIEWWITPKGKKMPFDLMVEGSSLSKPHHSTCPNADDFRKRSGVRSFD